MRGVKIQDTVESSGGVKFLNVDLKDILRLIGENVLTSKWRCWDLYYLKNINGEWCTNKEKKLKLSGIELIKFSESIGQIIDGHFEARGEGAAKHSWLQIGFFDSSWVEVWTSKPFVIEKIMRFFKDVTEISDFIRSTENS